MTLYYQSGTPDTAGVYACRVPRTDCPPGLYKDVFLMRSEGKWWHLGSDQRYRGEVASFLGPLARRDGLEPRSESKPPQYPSPPPLAPVYRMTDRARGYPHAAYAAQGWTDAQLLAHGYMERVM